MKLVALSALILALCLVAARTHAATPAGSSAVEGGLAAHTNRPLWGNLDAGAHHVGFKRLWHLDPFRPWPRSAALDSVAGSIARPLRFDVWYPAARCESGQTMPVSGYLRIHAPTPEFEDLVFLTHRYDAYSYRGLAGDTASFDRLMATPTASCLDAPAAQGPFPLVVYSAGWYNRAPDNTVLAEYLASHGFVVVAIPQLNPGLWTFSFASDAWSVENQIRDLEAAIAVVTSEPMVDRRRIAAMGYSTGGDVALLLQGRNPLVDAVIGLDASWTLGPGNDVAESPFFDGPSHVVPILAARRPAADRPGADAVLDSLSFAPRLVVEIDGADHGTFSDDPRMRLLLGKGAATHAETHTTMARVVRLFLAAALNAEPGPFDGLALDRAYDDFDVSAAFHRPAVQDTAVQ